MSTARNSRDAVWHRKDMCTESHKQTTLADLSPDCALFQAAKRNFTGHLSSGKVLTKS